MHGSLVLAAQRVRPRRVGVHRHRDEVGLVARPASRLEEDQRAIRQGVTADGRLQRLGFEHRLRHVVVGLEHRPGHGRRPGRAVEDLGRGPHVDVEVVQRATADARPLHDVDLLEGQVLEEPVRAAVLPERPGHLADRAGEVVALPALSPLEHRHRLAVLGEPAGDDGAAEPRADHDDVVGVPHGLRRRDPWG